MKILKESHIDHVLSFYPEIFKDHRGENFETFNEENLNILNSSFGIPRIKFIVDSYSFSKQNVIRGFHGDEHTWKLVQCLYGSIQLVIIDLRKTSKTNGESDIFYLDDKNKRQILIPAGCVNAHLCISKKCIFNYKLSGNYICQDKQIHVKWNDPKYNIKWNIKNPILSKRDL